MKIGRLRQRITFEQFTEVDNGFGEPERTWVEYLSCRAEVLPEGAGEQLATGQELSQVRYKITVRASGASRGITNEMRAVYDGQLLDLSPPRKVAGRERYLEFTAVARATEQ